MPRGINTVNQKLGAKAEGLEDSKRADELVDIQAPPLPGDRQDAGGYVCMYMSLSISVSLSLSLWLCLSLYI